MICRCNALYPETPELDNPDRTVCLICNRAIAPPIDHRYPVFDLTTQRDVPIFPEISTIEIDWQPNRTLIRRGKITIVRPVPGADRTAQREFLLEAA